MRTLFIIITTLALLISSPIFAEQHLQKSLELKKKLLKLKKDQEAHIIFLKKQWSKYIKIINAIDSFENAKKKLTGMHSLFKNYRALLFKNKLAEMHRMNPGRKANKAEVKQLNQYMDYIGYNKKNPLPPKNLKEAKKQLIDCTNEFYSLDLKITADTIKLLKEDIKNIPIKDSYQESLRKKKEYHEKLKKLELNTEALYKWRSDFLKKIDELNFDGLLSMVKHMQKSLKKYQEGLFAKRVLALGLMYASTKSINDFKELKNLLKYTKHKIKIPLDPKNLKEAKKQAIDCINYYYSMKLKLNQVEREYWKHMVELTHKEELTKHKKVIAMQNEEIKNLKRKISSLENQPTYYGTSTTSQNKAITYAPIPESDTTKAFFAKPVEKSSSWSSKPYDPYPGMVRINSTTYMKPNAYGPGIGMDQYGRAVKTVPAFK